MSWYELIMILIPIDSRSSNSSLREEMYLRALGKKREHTKWVSRSNIRRQYVGMTDQLLLAIFQPDTESCL